MSAYVMDKESIDALVATALAAFPQHPLDADVLGESLVWECVRSVAYRYPNDNVAAGELPGPCDPYYLTPYLFPPTAAPLPADEALEVLRSYEYQSCEHPQWEESSAHKLCEILRVWLEAQPKPKPPVEPTMAPEEFAARYGNLSRAETIKRIREALKRRSGKSWSVTGGKGTAYGWINIDAPPKRRTGAHVQRAGAEIGEYEHVDTGEPQRFGIMTPQDCAELAQLLGKDRVHHQGESIPSGSDYYREYIDRAEGREIETYGKQYWD